MITINLSKPLTIKDKKIERLEIDLDKLTGMDLVKAEREARAMGDTSPMMALSMQYQAAVAARALGVPADDIMSLCASDFQKVVLPVANFLLGTA